MNQILQVKETNKSSKFANIKDIVLLFVIIIIVFGLAFGAYIIYKNIIKDIPKPPIQGNNVVVPKYAPNITLTQLASDKLTINVESEIGISNITYNWNNEQKQIIEVDGKNNIQKTIDIPIGENIIYITVTNINGEEATKQKTYIYELPKPIIVLSIVGNDIKINVTSEIELSEVIYQWNSETEKKQNMITYNNRNEFEKQIEIPIGQNTLKVIAVDANGSKTEKVQEIKGVTKATTKTQVLDGYWHFTVTGKENIKTVEFEFNGRKYLMNKDTFGETKIVHYKVKLEEGMNSLKITSITESEGIDTTQWSQEYTKE